jgi:hypothetical protein
MLCIIKSKGLPSDSNNQRPNNHSANQLCERTGDNEYSMRERDQSSVKDALGWERNGWETEARTLTAASKRMVVDQIQQNPAARLRWEMTLTHNRGKGSPAYLPTM